MPTVHVDVITPLPEGWGICLTCEAIITQVDLLQTPSERGMDDYPTEWQEYFQRFSETILELSWNYADSVRFHVWDPRSFQGLLKAIRFGAHRYPTFIVNKHVKVVGLDMAKLGQALLSAGANPVSDFTSLSKSGSKV